MSLGYYFGSFYDSSFDNIKRQKLFKKIGFAALLLFIILNFINKYGDPLKWSYYDTVTKTLMSFFNHQKYPPSLLFLLMTLGPSLLFLAAADNLKDGKVLKFFSIFGRVPFFYYIIHFYLIHMLAMLFGQFSGYNWQSFIFSNMPTDQAALKGFGFPLWIVYLVWIMVIAILYPICKKFDAYKSSHKEKWWLSYL